jgi:hypothetical protein
MVHDDNHAIYLASSFDVKAKPVHTKAKPLRLKIIKAGFGPNPLAHVRFSLK